MKLIPYLWVTGKFPTQHLRTLQSETVELGQQVSSKGNLTLQSRITVGSEEPVAIAENNKGNSTESHPPNQVTKGKVDVREIALRTVEMLCHKLGLSKLYVYLHIIQLHCQYRSLKLRVQFY